MRVARVVLAFLVGALVFTGVVIYLGGYLAAFSSPRGYFAFFGPENKLLALAVLNLGTWALPIATASFLCFSAFLTAQRQDRQVRLGLVLGMLFAFAYWSMPADSTFGLGQALAVFESIATPVVVAPWLSVPNIAAPWLGFLLALHVAARRQTEA